MVSTFLSLIETQAGKIFRNCKHFELQQIIDMKKKEYEKIKSSFKDDEQEKIDDLLLAYSDYIQNAQWEDKDNCVILAFKIGIELGKYFEVLEDL